MKLLCPNCGGEVPAFGPRVCRQCGAKFMTISALLSNWKVLLTVLALMFAYFGFALYGLYRAGFFK